MLFKYISVGCEGLARPGPGVAGYLQGVIGEGNTFSVVCKLRWNFLNMKINDNIWPRSAGYPFSLGVVLS